MSAMSIPDVSGEENTVVSLSQNITIKRRKNVVVSKTESEELSATYQRKTEKEHILSNPDTYVGSVELVDSNIWIFDDETDRIVLRNIEYVPALYKLFDEGIVNCRDHIVRMLQSVASDKKCVSYINVSIDNDGMFTFENNGNGIDVVRHPDHPDLWIPEMIFAHLRTSTNYNRDEKKITGGKNGFGVKLIFVWSTYGSIETVDHVRGLKYTQEFSDNLNTISAPIITKIKSSKPYTKITFMPDYTRMKLSGLTDDMRALLKKRVYDISAVSDHSVNKIKVSLNDNIVPVKNFQQYVDLYIGPKGDAKRIYERYSDRWEYSVAITPTGQFENVSFVNGIATLKGGKHVDYIMGQITRKIAALIEAKKKTKVNPNTIKEQLILFLRCDIVNPSFDSQTKDYMNTPSSGFGSTCAVSDEFIEKLSKMGVITTALALSELKDMRSAKKSDGIKTRSVRGIANFVDANFAGTAQSNECMLILCEGLSAMSGVVSGLSGADRNIIGIYPMKGKLLNVRGEQTKKIGENKEISDIKKILGLETGREYKTESDVHRHLRYSKVMILTDADTDGSHIKALCINVFHSEWTSLFRMDGFLSFMNTPILTAKRGAVSLRFYNEGEHRDWLTSLGPSGSSGWTLKYFKGLGTSTSAEFKQYFADKKIVDFIYNNDDDYIDKVFNKLRANERKIWIEAYDRMSFLDTTVSRVNYSDFIEKELIHFSVYDCERSIPNMVDGLKISQRKILFAAFKRRLISEIKVAQFAGYISEHACYHHGEASLNGAIVNMAQNFMGSNNINVLMPNGQFGTRGLGGSDSASERYIFTQLNGLTRDIFPEQDDKILVFLEDDGTPVEPKFYIPIIPFVLVNGISGIGTGFSTTIPPYNPIQIIDYIRRRLSYCELTLDNNDIEPYIVADEISTEFMPYYDGFKGTVSKIDDHKYMLKGTYEKISDTSLRITELPVGTWTMPYITYLETLMDGGINKKGDKIVPDIKDFVSNSTEKIVDILVNFPKGQLDKLEADTYANDINGIEKLLKLSSSVSTTNIHLFDETCRLKKYSSAEEIIEAFYVVRLEAYTQRKTQILSDMHRELTRLSNRARYISLTLDDTVDLRRKSGVVIHDLLEGHSFAVIDGSYDYLIKMPMNSVSQENVAKLLKDKTTVELQIAELMAKSIYTMWLDELLILETHYLTYKTNRSSEYCASLSKSNGKLKSKLKSKTKNT